jgi:hypothetical protein
LFGDKLELFGSKLHRWGQTGNPKSLVELCCRLKCGQLKDPIEEVRCYLSPSAATIGSPSPLCWSYLRERWDERRWLRQQHLQRESIAPTVKNLALVKGRLNQEIDWSPNRNPMEHLMSDRTGEHDRLYTRSGAPVTFITSTLLDNNSKVSVLRGLL